MPGRRPLRESSELAGVFLRLGATAFGGPAAHIAMMEREFVGRKAWLTREEFVDMIGAANLVPGPSSTEVAIHVGMRRAGVAGLVIAGACFILPAALMVSCLAWAYVRYGQTPSLQAALYGIKPVVVAIVAQAIVLLLAKVVDSWPKRVVLVGGAVLAWLGVKVLGVLLGSGIVLGANALRKERSLGSAAPLVALAAAIAATAAIPIAVAALRSVPPRPDAWSIFLYFAKLGSVLYGSGYVLFAFLERDLVVQWHWLTKGGLIDAVAVGQFTPGPVFTTATFIGYVLAGPVGAAAATVGVFLPAFLFVGISGRVLPGLRHSPVSAGFLDGVNAAALALMGVVSVRLAFEALRDVPTAVICAVALGVLLKLKVNSALLVVAGAAAGMVIRAL